jgi:hypothetical protein
MKKSNLLTTTFLTLLTAKAFDSGIKTGWKLDADGKIEMKDGNPIYLNSNGDELTVSGTKISELNNESKTHREAKEKAEKALKAFEGIDPEVARKAVDTVKRLDAKQLIDSGEVDKLKEEIKNQFTSQLTATQKEKEDLQNQINNMKIGSIFKDSSFVRESIAVPADMFEASFRNQFKINDKGEIEAYDKSGNRIYSKEKSGEYASPEEALKILVEAHPQKDTIMKAHSASGSGSQGNGGSQGGGRVIKRADFEKLTPGKQAETSQLVAKGDMKIVD